MDLGSGNSGISMTAVGATTKPSSGGLELMLIRHLENCFSGWVLGQKGQSTWAGAGRCCL
jgi:hypothetical protein